MEDESIVIDLDTLRESFDLIVGDGGWPFGLLMAKEAEVPSVALHTILPPLRHPKHEATWFPDRPTHETLPGCLVACPPELDTPGNFSSLVRYGGPLLDLGGRRQVERAPRREDRKLIYASFGTRNVSHPLVIDILTRLADVVACVPEWSLIVGAGALSTELTRRSWPANIKIAKYVDQLDVLSRADAFVTHAGLNSVKEALYCEVPMLALPLVDDQLDNAYRIEHHGIGLRAKCESMTERTLEAALARLMHDPSFRRNADGLVRIFRDHARDDVHVEAIEDALRA